MVDDTITSQSNGGRDERAVTTTTVQQPMPWLVVV